MSSKSDNPEGQTVDGKGKSSLDEEHPRHPIDLADGMDALDALSPEVIEHLRDDDIKEEEVEKRNAFKEKPFLPSTDNDAEDKDSVEDLSEKTSARGQRNTIWWAEAKSTKGLLNKQRTAQTVDNTPSGIQTSRTPKTQRRILDRALPFFQSSGSVLVNFTFLDNDLDSIWAKRKLVLRDWFDTVMSFNTSSLLMSIMLFYTVLIFVWAGVYIGVSIQCDDSSVGIMSFQAAFAFSLETSTTVGYGLPVSNGIFFDGCGLWVLVIYIQQMLTMVLNAVITGAIIIRVQRADRRSNQIIFSNQCAVVCLKGRLYLTFQVFDLLGRKPVTGARVRVFCVFHEMDDESPAFWQVRAMRLTRPDDEIGAFLWLSVPNVIVHEIDPFSPLAPGLMTNPPKQSGSSIPNRFPQAPQRTMDGRDGSRAQAICPICGTGFQTEGSLRRHIIYMSEDEKHQKRPSSFGHRACASSDVSRPVVMRGSESQSQTSENFRTVTPSVMLDAIKTRIRARNIEVIVLIEAADPRTSNTFQARHSYMIDEFVFQKQHTPCMGVGPDGGAQVNLTLFHKFIEVDPNVEDPIPFCSHS